MLEIFLGLILAARAVCASAGPWWLAPDRLWLTMARLLLDSFGSTVLFIQSYVYV